MSNEHLTANGIQDFLERYKTAKNQNSKEIRLTIAEADKLNSGLAILLERHRKLSDNVITLQEQLLSQEGFDLSGGEFK